MGNGLRAQARRVLLQQVAPAYHDPSGAQRQRLLEDVVSATGYARKHAQWLLSHAEEVLAPPPVLRRRYEAGYTSASHPTSELQLVSFDLAACAAKHSLVEADALSSQEQSHARVLNWRRTSNDPFAGHWELILTWVQANPTRSK